MTRRIPMVPTIIVALAVAAMIALGMWQLQRKAWKEALLAQYAGNLHRPAIAFPRVPVGDRYLFRRAGLFCLEPVAWQTQGGRSVTGTHGWRHIALCRTGAEGPLVPVDMGVSREPFFKPQWQGGRVTGTISHAPDHQSLLMVMLGQARPRGLMLVSDSAAPGLETTAPPDLSSVPNNHFAYAVQWFLFAVVATVIYVLALRWRERGAGRHPD